MTPVWLDRFAWARLPYVGFGAALALVAGLAAPGLASADLLDPAAKPFPQPAVSCQEYVARVAIAPGQPATYRVATTLCSPPPRGGRTLQLLLHGITYSRLYWDFPYQPERYSYMRAATAAGYATLNIDRLGIAASDHPPAGELTNATNAYVVHQLVQQLRAGTLTGDCFDTIVLVGHSLGALISLHEAATYNDVDGMLISGYVHSAGSEDAFGALALTPAQSEPRLADRPLGYLTTWPGMRGQMFYYPPEVDPQVLALDEATKETLTAAEITDLYPSAMLSLNIQVPVLVVIGQLDSLFCNTLYCEVLDTQALERSFYPRALSFELVLIPNSGHDINLHYNAPTWFAVARSWFDRRLGTGQPSQ